MKPYGSRLLVTLGVSLPIALAACGDTATTAGDTKEVLFPDTGLGEVDAPDTGDTTDVVDTVDTTDTADTTDTRDSEDGVDGDLGPDVVEPVVVDWCRLQFPTDLTVGAASSFVVYGRVYAAGVTDKSTGNDPVSTLKARLGRGAAGTDPATWSTWVTANVNPGWDGAASGEADNDEYMATMQPAGLTGEYDFAFAFSLDNGTTWTYCDRDAGEGKDGAEDGFSSADAGHLVVVADPCGTNPCTTPPATCDGSTLRLYPATGTCKDEGGQAACTYTPTTTTDCAATSRFCDAGTRSCVSNPCSPNPCNAPPAAACVGNARVTFAASGTCTSSTGTASCDYAEASRTDCGAAFCLDGSCRDTKPAGPGDLVITEIMFDPTAVADGVGEWFEVKNVSATTIDLAGLTVKDAGTEQFQIPGPLTLAAGATLVLGRNGVALDNGGVTVGFVYGTAMTLANSGDSIRIVRGNTVLDEVSYASGWPLAAGKSLSLDRDKAASNDLAASWCVAQAKYNAVDYGSPGADNPNCPLSGIWCRLQFPLDLTVTPATNIDAYGRVFVAGLTDRTTGNDLNAQLVLQAGLGARGAQASTFTTWVAAAANAGYDGSEANNDEYRATLVAPNANGNYDFAFRASGDGGATWTYCDRNAGAGSDGAEDGYQPANAGKLTVQISTNVCDPNPCTTGKPAACEGQIAVSYAANGTCSVVSDQASCAYAEAGRVDCGATGRFCQDGACTDARPAGVGDLLITEIMANPKAVTDENGEWFELQNVSSVRVNLKGVSYVDNSTVATAVVTIANDLYLDPGAFAVFARSADSGVNGGVSGVAGVFTFGLSNSGDFIRVYRGNDTISLANYGSTGTSPLNLVIPDGASLQLDKAATVTTDKNDWCAGTTSYGAGDKGTPGAANVKCRERIGWCRLQFPTSGVYGAGQAFTAYGRYFAAGLSDVDKTANDTSPFIRAAFAIAPKPANAADATAAATWTWVAATANASYGPSAPGFEANNDEWSRAMTAPASVGDYVLGFRVSGDSGATWTYCDTNKGAGADGSENGFSSLDAGQLSVSDVCTPNPCAGAAPTCSGETLMTYPAQGVCTVVSGQASCAPGVGAPTNCAATQKRCDPAAPACVQCLGNSDCVGPFEVCSAERTCVAGCVADRLEPNDSLGAPTVLASNTVLTDLNLCAGDVDVFAADIALGATVSLRVDFTLPAGSSGVAVDLVAPDGTTLPGPTTTVSPFEFSTPVPVGGVWKAVVRGADAAARASYTIALSFGGDPCSPNPCTTSQAPRCEGQNLFTPTVPGTCTAPSGQPSCSYAAGTTTVCVAGCSAGACRPYRAPAVGELVVTEVFASGVLGPQTQWFEVYNASTDYLDLDGLVVKNDLETRMTLVGTRIMAPMSYLVFGRNTDTAANGGVNVDVVFGGTALDPVTDQVILATASAGVIDEVRWTGAWPRGADKSTSFDGALVGGGLAATLNDAAASWCLGATGFGNGSLGTPGVANPPCVELVEVSASTPAIGATAASPTAPIVLDFTAAMNATTLSTQTAAGACTGNVRLSYNNFTTCVGFSAATAPLSNGGKRATLTPLGGMAYGVGYALRVTTGATSAAGTPLGATWNATFTTTATACGGAPVTIAQVYGGGGNQGATYSRDFVELKNRTAQPVQLRGWSLQYASSTGTNWSNNLALSGVIPAGSSFLVQLATGGANGSALPTADLTGTTDMGAAAGKVALLTGTAQAPTGTCPPSDRIVDFVGYGTTANCNETTNAPAPSTTTAVHRDVMGCVDEGDGATDFMPFLPVPHNSASGASFCACVSDVVANDQVPALAVEADYCNLQFPSTISVVRNTATPDVYGRIYEGGLTNTSAGQAAGVVAQLGFGRAGTSPTAQKRWAFFPATFNVETDGGANDEYKRSFTAPAVNALKAYAYTYRFSLDGGASWTYCDLDGAGANDPLTFDSTQLGTLEVKIQ